MIHIIMLIWKTFRTIANSALPNIFQERFSEVSETIKTKAQVLQHVFLLRGIYANKLFIQVQVELTQLEKRCFTWVNWGIGSPQES